MTDGPGPALGTGAPVPPVQFGLANPAGAAVLTIGEGLAANRLKLTLTNSSSSVLSLRGGVAVPEDKATASSPSTLYLKFGSLLTVEQQAGLSISAAGWTATQLGSPATWSLAPDADTPVAAGARVSFAIDVGEVSRPASPGYVTVDYINLGKVPNGFQQIPVARQNPPPPRSVPLVLDIGLIGSTEITVTTSGAAPVSNDLKLAIANPSKTDPLVPATTPWDPKARPVFYLSFVYGAPPAGYFALTTAQLAESITVAVAQQGGNTWTVDPQPAGANPVWTLTPQDHAVLGVGADGIIELDITGIVSQLPPGTTLLYLQYANIPGYTDGTTTTFITKQPQLQITEFTPIPPWAPPNTTTPVTLNWTVVGDPTSLELAQPVLKDVTGKTSYPWPSPLDKTTGFSLRAARGSAVADANTSFEIAEYQIVAQATVATDEYVASGDPAVLLRSHCWDVLYLLFRQLPAFGKTAGLISVRDSTTGALITTFDALEEPEDVGGMLLSPPVVDGADRLVLGPFMGGKAHVWDIAEDHSATKVAEVAVPDGLGVNSRSTLLGFRPGGDLVFAGMRRPDSKYAVWQADPLGVQPPERRFFDPYTFYAGHAMAPDGNHVVLFGWVPTTDPQHLVIRKVDLTTGAVVDEVAIGPGRSSEYWSVSAVLVDPDGGGYISAQYAQGPEVVYAPLDGTGTFERHALQTPVFTTNAGHYYCTQAQLSPSGRDLVLAPAEGPWITPSSALLGGIQVKMANAGPFAFEPDGSGFAAVSSSLAYPSTEQVVIVRRSVGSHDD